MMKGSVRSAGWVALDSVIRKPEAGLSELATRRSSMLNRRKPFALAVCVAVSLLSAFCGGCTSPPMTRLAPAPSPTLSHWINGNGDWNDAAHWDSGVPGGSTEAQILCPSGNPDPCNTVTLDVSPKVSLLWLTKGNSLITPANAVRTLQVSQALFNSGVIQANADGHLTLTATSIYNTGGTIQALDPNAGGRVSFVQYSGRCVVIKGGTLGNISDSCLTLDGRTTGGFSDPITVTGTYDVQKKVSYLLGTIINEGEFRVEGGLIFDWNTVTEPATLKGGGKVSLLPNTKGLGGNSYLVNEDNIIQGEGSLGLTGTLGWIHNMSRGSIVADSTGSASTLKVGGYGTLINEGTLQVKAGNTLQVTNALVDPKTGKSVANLIPSGTYLVYGTGGAAGTLKFTNFSIATLPVSSSATILLDGSDAYVKDKADRDVLENFSNSGTLTIQNGRNFTTSTAYGHSFNNDDGQFIVGKDSGFFSSAFLSNINGAIRAEGSGATLEFRESISNDNGTIRADGPGTSVRFKSLVTGGTLMNAGGDFFGTPSRATGTVLNGVTVRGTYTADEGSTTGLDGTIRNEGELLVRAGVGKSTFLQVFNPYALVTLTGGGVIVLSSAASGGDAGLITKGGQSIKKLINQDNTLRGAGRIDVYGPMEVGADGAIVADATGAQTTLSVGDSSGGLNLSNSGTLQANAGSTLEVNAKGGGFLNYTTSTQTLKGGTYRIFSTATKSGVLRVKLASGVGQIKHNAASILLDGPRSQFVDESGQDVLSAFSDNQQEGRFTIVNGRIFQIPASTFTNSGEVVVGERSRFLAGGYSQASGSTEVDGVLSVSAGGKAGFAGGSLLGRGVVQGMVTTGGVIAPGRLGQQPGAGSLATEGLAGTLAIKGDYNQTAGTLELDVGGVAAGKSFGKLLITGKATLAGRLQINPIHGFTPKSGNRFTFLVAKGGISGTFAERLAPCPDCITKGCFEPVYSRNSVTLVFHSDSRRCRELQ